MSATRPAATSRAACLKSRFSSLRVGRAQIRAGHFFVNSVKPKRNRPADIYPELLREAADFACDREVVLRREEQTEIRAAKHIEDRIWFRESGEIAEKVMPLHRPVCTVQNERVERSRFEGGRAAARFLFFSHPNFSCSVACSSHTAAPAASSRGLD